MKYEIDGSGHFYVNGVRWNMSKYRELLKKAQNHLENMTPNKVGYDGTQEVEKNLNDVKFPIINLVSVVNNLKGSWYEDYHTTCYVFIDEIYGFYRACKNSNCIIRFQDCKIIKYDIKCPVLYKDIVKNYVENNTIDMINNKVYPAIGEALDKIWSKTEEKLSRALNNQKQESGVKYDSDKLDWSLLPIDAIEEVIKVLMFGAKKYSANNWKHVDDFNRRYYNASLRHLTQRQQGEILDSDSNLSHLAHAACNVLFLLSKELEYVNVTNK